MAKTKGQKELERGTAQVKGGARQAEAGAEEVATGALDETQRRLSRLAALPGELTEQGHRIWLAGLGALSTVEEEGSQFFSDLVDRGAKLEKRGREQVNEAAHELSERQKSAVKTATGTAANTVSAVEQTATGLFRTVFGRLDVPTRSEVQGLAAKVERLAQKLDGLAVTLEKQSGQATADVQTTDLTVYHVSPHDEGWAVEKEGAERATSVYPTKKEAVEGGRELARTHAPSELVVHKQDRSVQETFTYQEPSEE